MTKLNWKKQYTPSRAELAEWMRLSRKIAGMTQAEMSNVLNMSKDELNGYEKGNTVADETMARFIVEGIAWQVVHVVERVDRLPAGEYT